MRLEHHGPAIYLASRSPRRREILNQLGVRFEDLLMHEQHGADVDETPHPGEAPRDYVLRVARAKALLGWRQVASRQLTRLPVLAADTTVVLGDQILGKPDNAAHACHLLRTLSARTHEVMSAVAVACEERLETALSVSTVEFRQLDDAEIDVYVASGEPLDKAGAYAIQGEAAIFVRALTGSYSSIMGLPLIDTAELLRRFDVQSTWGARD
ncbi:MAG: septum formation inhibitor Maf [Betaproteobacteria bacterium]|nr:septum formation inhibitor Maf [Betaproteobacteria bacterium]